MSEKYIRIRDAVDALAKTMPTPATPDGAGEFDHEIHIADEAFADAIRIIESLKPADVAPVVHGRWIWKPTIQYCPPDCWYPPLSRNEETWDEKNGTWLENEMYCSECDYHNYREIKYNFCPNCGAKMDGGENG